jgi:hypothetical protein
MLPELSNMLSWWQWAILGAVPPAIVLLYFLKLKRRPLEVPSTYLWHKSIEDLHVNSIWQRLRNNLLLYLQLAVVALIVAALLRPSWQALHLSGNRLVLLIDNSASMQATDVKPSRLEEAKRRVGELIDGMRSGDAAMLISFSDVARVEQNFTDDRQQLRAALEAIKPSQHSTNISEALKLAAGLVNPGQANENSTDIQVAGTKLLIFSDGRFPDVPNFGLGNLDPIFVPIGQPDAANVGVVAFGVSRADDNNGKLQAFARLQNFGPEKAEVRLKLFTNDQVRPSDADHLSIPPGETSGLAFPLDDFDAGVLHLQAETGDQLALDDEAWLVVSPPRRARVLLITPKNERLEQVLKTKAAASVAEVTVENTDFLKSKSYEDQVDLGVWDLVIYDRAPPAKMPRTNTFFVGCIPPGGIWKAKPEVVLPQVFDAAVTHRLMQWVDVNEIQKVVSATPLEVPGGGVALIDSDAGPLLAIAPRDGFEDLVLGMTLLEERTAADGSVAVYRNTDWPWRASFATFALNLLTDRAGGQDLSASGTYRPGMAVSLDAPDTHTGLEVQTPSGESVQLPPSSSGKLTFTATDKLGVYRVLAGGKLVEQFAVNLLDPNESNIRPPTEPTIKIPTIKIGDVSVVGKTGWEAGHRDIWKELVLGGLAIVLLEWLVYLRRVYI